jgi:dihydrofolate reductase
VTWERPGRGSWFTTVGDKDRELWARTEFEEAMGAAALLMGRRSYEWFVAVGWESRDGEWADRLRALPKYVVTSSALDGPGWSNSMVLTGDVVTAVSKLREQVDGEIVVYGSGRLAHTLIEHDLVDELRLVTYPIVIGAGGGGCSARHAARSPCAWPAAAPSVTASPCSPTSRPDPPDPAAPAYHRRRGRAAGHFPAAQALWMAFWSASQPFWPGIESMAIPFSAFRVKVSPNWPCWLQGAPIASEWASCTIS